MDKLSELLSNLVARLKIQISIRVGIVFYYMPFDAILVLHMNNDFLGRMFALAPCSTSLSSFQADSNC